uniref:Essential MCU regulator, mitochondrial n=1 Tax=Schistosoma japonicum TaxID=6182 RepID=Q5BQX3_SCHJA|nr:SJCHGC09773 protein [Schistosoma japonicum]
MKVRLLQPVFRSMSSNAFYKGAYKESGAFCDRPQIMRFGILRSLAVGIPFIFIGSMISRTGAELLEEYDIFTPQDD